LSFGDLIVQPLLEKYSDFQKLRLALYPPLSRPT
jgi:hypothetical protein